MQSWMRDLGDDCDDKEVIVEKIFRSVVGDWPKSCERCGCEVGDEMVSCKRTEN